MTRYFTGLLIAALTTTASAQTAQEILEEVIQRDLERKGSVQNYIVTQTTLGQPMMLYYEKSQRQLDNGQTFDTFRLVPPNEIAERQNQGSLSPAEMELYAQGLERTGEALSQGIAESGLPASSLMVPGSYDEPWASPDPRVMTGSMAMFMRAAADAERDRLANGTDTDLASYEEQMNLMMADAELVGTESVDGRPAFHIQADDLNYVQSGDGGEQFIVNSVSLWIDREQYVPLQVRMNGLATIEGQQQEMFMEMLSLNYEQIGPLYESTRQVMRMGGILTPEQQAQMAQAQEQMAEMEAQLAGLSGPERQMLENMLGPQMEMMRNLVNNGTIEVETQIQEIRVNAGLPDQAEMASAFFNFGGAGAAGGLNGASAGGAAGFGGFGGAAGLSGSGAAPGSAANAEPAVDPAAQQACLQEKIEAAQAAQPRRRGLGGLLGGIGQAVSQLGNLDIAGLASSLYEPGSSDEEFEERARELGLTEEDIAECRSPAGAESAAPALDF